MNSLPAILLLHAVYSSSAHDSAQKVALLNSIFDISTPSAQESPQPTTLVPLTNKNGINDEVRSCAMEDGFIGECVPYYLCENGTIIKDGTGLFDIRISDEKCLGVLESCCSVSKIRQPNNPIKPPSADLKVERTGCGWRNSKGADMRTTGEVNGETKFGEFPWMCAIYTVVPPENPQLEDIKLYVGGGSLIHPSVVLTVAHYVATANQLEVRAGEWDTQSNNEIYPHQDRLVKTTVVHSGYNSRNLFNDIALLFLAQPMVLSPHVGVACLPPQSEQALPASRCFATGWGKDKFEKGGRYQAILKKVDLPVLDNGVCQSLLRRTHLGRHFKLHSTFMCAGAEAGKDTCRGDGGSPLSCPIQYETDRYVQRGMVAWGIGCNSASVPGVYVDVSAQRDWIDDTVSGLGYDTSVYTYNGTPDAQNTQTGPDVGSLYRRLQ